jgi:hypothetical protein
LSDGVYVVDFVEVGLGFVGFGVMAFFLGLGELFRLISFRGVREGLGLAREGLEGCRRLLFRDYSFYVLRELILVISYFCCFLYILYISFFFTNSD